MTHGHLCQRPVFSVGVSQHMHKIINLWKIELNWSSKLRDSNGRNIHPCHTELCAFRCLISRRHAWGHEIKFKYFSGKLLLSRKLRYFREYCSLNSLFFFTQKRLLLKLSQIFQNTTLPFTVFWGPPSVWARACVCCPWRWVHFCHVVVLCTLLMTKFTL